MCGDEVCRNSCVNCFTACTGGGPVARVWVINSTVKGYIPVRGTGVSF